MKNRDENTTIIQFSYSGSTIFEIFFKQFNPICLDIKKCPLKGHLNNIINLNQD